MKERTLILIKPDGVRKHLENEIKRRLTEKSGFRIVAEKAVPQVSRELAEKHYEDLGRRRGEAAKRRMVNFLTLSPVVVMVLEGENVVEGVRKTVGATEPVSAEKGTIRGDLADDSFAKADAEDRAVENLVHASDSPATAEAEINLWFDSKELKN